MAGSNNPENKRVLPVEIVTEMRDSYIDYAMSVIVARALPDARDGLKPVHRRILYAMHRLGLSASAKPRKSATVVGEVLGKFHPHGDIAVYDALVRLAQDFAMRYPLIQGQGNFGSIDGDAAAAMRYTEVRLAKLSAELLRDLDKETVTFVPNYDGAEREPMVLPSAVPQLLLNGTVGIAVGMATKIPPHNLGELTAALEHLLTNPDATNDDLFEFVPGPDFPTGGLVYGEKDLAHAYATGRGGVLVRGEAEIVETKNGQHSIIISSLPYQVNKSDFIVNIADQVHEKKLDGIRDLRDESAKQEIRIVVELKTGAQPQKILNALYKHTELETMFHYNMLALTDGVPRLLPLKTLLEVFLDHRRVVIINRTKFDLKEAEARAHILEGLKKALDHIDAVIKTIKEARDVAAAQAALQKKFDLSDLQASAILEMKLSKLAGLERQKVEDELKEKLNLIKDLKDILAKPERVKKVIKEELADIKNRYGDERRTKIIKGGVKEISDADLIPEKENILVVTAGGYIKRTDPGEYRAQKRGGVGVVDLDVKEEDFVTIFLTANTHSDLLFFTDRGKVYQIKMYEVPEGKRSTRGKSVMNFLALAAEERITSILALPPGAKTAWPSLLMVTRQGVAKKVKAASFHDVRRSGLVAIKLKNNDELLAVCPVEKGSEVILGTTRGQAIRFKESDIREMGRTAGGVKAMRLSSGDQIIGAHSIRPQQKDETYLVVGKNGYGKKTKLKEYKIQKRGGSGIKTFKVTTKVGQLIAARVVTAEMQELIAISKQGQVIRTKLSEIPTLSRATQGVRLMKLRPGDELASITSL